MRVSKKAKIRKLYNQIPHLSPRGFGENGEKAHRFGDLASPAKIKMIKSLTLKVKTPESKWFVPI